MNHPAEATGDLALHTTEIVTGTAGTRGHHAGTTTHLHPGTGAPARGTTAAEVASTTRPPDTEMSPTAAEEVHQRNTARDTHRDHLLRRNTRQDHQTRDQDLQERGLTPEDQNLKTTSSLMNATHRMMRGDQIVERSQTLQLKEDHYRDQRENLHLKQEGTVQKEDHLHRKHLSRKMAGIPVK